MKKDYITLVDVGDSDRELTALEVFYLKEPIKPDEVFIVDDAGCDIKTGKYMGGGLAAHLLSEALDAHDGWDDPLADELPTLDSLCGNEMDVNENSAGGGAHAAYVPDDQPCDEEGYLEAIEGCCPTGPKGETGPRGIDEEKMYPLILDSLRKFSKCQVDLSKDSACEVLADGITQKIIKYMWGK